eukprot:CAMPEP_0167772686 /NCGR_PEP_ID=MMETSP0111_2-20121227/985_1 /TAXON_ID=91324 /ORGANISM="Lotharella globosa, Strain CCCM811" /LENGTH=350 /DNA_ID=CAMNT_0007662205 /DNA_START=147 /DNA_END=1200 /DNA_ORIENTATION=-
MTRVNESDITLEQLLKEQQPKLILLDKPLSWDWDKLQSSCGSSRVSLISNATYSTLLQLPPTVVRSVEIMMTILHGDIHYNLNNELTKRIDYPLSAYVTSSTKQKRHIKVRRVPFGFRFLPTELRLLYDVLARPLYLHDVPLNVICPELMDDLVLPTTLSQNSIHFSRDSWVRKEAQDNPYVFFGPKNSMSYPMHQNIFPADVLMVMVEGTKAFTAFHPNQREHLHPLLSMGTSLYAADALSPDLYRTPNLKHAKGIRDVLTTGEMLFLPGSYIHQFQNIDPGPNIGLKFWVGGRSHMCSSDQECEHLIRENARKDVKAHFLGDPRHISLADYRNLHSDAGLVAGLRRGI